LLTTKERRGATTFWTRYGLLSSGHVMAY
jgi:hypothetical protein